MNECVRENCIKIQEKSFINDLTPRIANIFNLESTVGFVKELVQEGADVNARDEFYRTPLHIAIFLKRHSSVVRGLLDLGADVNAKDVMGQTPLIYAMYLDPENDSLIKEILQRGGDPNSFDLFGHSPLQCSIETCYSAILEELLEYGADIFAGSPHNQQDPYISVSPLIAALNSEMYIYKLIVKVTLIKMIDPVVEKISLLLNSTNSRRKIKILKYAKECIREIERMKLHRITLSASLYDFVSKISQQNRPFPEGFHIRPLYMSLENECGFMKEYPIYRGKIKSYLHQNILRGKLLKKMRAQNAKGSSIKLNFDCFSKIADYLSNIDLNSLIIALEFQSSTFDLENDSAIAKKFSKRKKIKRFKQ